MSNWGRPPERPQQRIYASPFQPHPPPFGIPNSAAGHGRPAPPQPAYGAYNAPLDWYTQEYPPVANQPKLYQDPYANNWVQPRPVLQPTEDLEDTEDKPLLEELGINPRDVLRRMASVMLFQSLDEDQLAHLDLTGPILILVALACSLLGAGKVQFGYVYALSTGGSLGLWILLNLMSRRELLDMYRTLSILGYSLLPLVGLSLMAIFVHLKTMYGVLACVVAVSWSTLTASRFFVLALEMEQQRFLVAYPIFLFYASFILLTVF